LPSRRRHTSVPGTERQHTDAACTLPARKESSNAGNLKLPDEARDQARREIIAQALALGLRDRDARVLATGAVYAVDLRSQFPGLEVNDDPGAKFSVPHAAELRLFGKPFGYRVDFDCELGGQHGEQLLYLGIRISRRYWCLIRLSLIWLRGWPSVFDSDYSE
jgi:hypothetical protein